MSEKRQKPILPQELVNSGIKIMLKKLTGNADVKQPQIKISKLHEHFMLPPFEEGMPIPEELKQYYDIKDREVYDVITDFDKSPSELSNIQKQLRKKYLGIILSLMNQSNDMIKNIIAKNLNSMPTGSTSWEETQDPTQDPTPTRTRMSVPLDSDTTQARTTVLTQTITNDPTQDITMAPTPTRMPIPLASEGYQEDVNFLDNYEALFNTIKRIINLLIMEIDLNTEIEIAPCNKKPYIITIGVLSVILVIMIFIGIMGIMGIIRFNK